MVGNIQPLERQNPIIDEGGRPTIYFIRWAQQRMQDIKGAVSPEEALEIAEQFVLEFLAAHPIGEGVGIDITPSGNIADGITISANVQAILDVISSTQGAILYRGATEWEALAAGTPGYVLSTNGPGVDPSWVVQSGGGGGASLGWTLVGTIAPSGLPDEVFTGLGTYTELMIVGTLVAKNLSGNFGLQFSPDGGATYANANYRASGAVGTGSAAAFFSLNTSNAVATRSFGLHIQNFNVALPSFCINGQTGAFLIQEDSTAFDALRIFNTTTGGTLTGGSIKVYGR